MRYEESRDNCHPDVVRQRRNDVVGQRRYDLERLLQENESLHREVDLLERFKVALQADRALILKKLSNLRNQVEDLELQKARFESNGSMTLQEGVE